MEEKNKEMIEKWRVLDMLDYLEEHLNTTSTMQLKTIIKNYKSLVKTLHNQFNKNNNDEKKLKGYQFDSLVYRYIRAREQMAEYEFYKNSPRDHDKEYYYKQAKRDIMRFCQILDEVIGEHE